MQDFGFFRIYKEKSMDFKLNKRMKKLNLILCSLVVLLLSACNSSEVGVRYTLCKNKVSSRWLPEGEETYLAYKVDGSALKVDMINYISNCGTEEVDVEVTHNEGNQIEVLITEIGPSANCTCPMDVSFSLPDLKKDETYECVVKAKTAGGSVYFPQVTFSFTVKKGASGKIVY